MANRDNPSGFEAEMTLTGTNIPMWRGKLRSNTIVTKGDFLHASSGYLEISSVRSTVAGVCHTAQATSVTTTPDILFIPAVDWVVFSGQCSGTMTQALVWTRVDFEGTTGIMEVNENATAGGAPLNIIGIKPNSSIGANTEVRFIVRNSDFTGKGI